MPKKGGGKGKREEGRRNGGFEEKTQKKRFC